MSHETIPRALLAEAFDNPRLIAAFEDQSIAVAEASGKAEQLVASTERMEDATVLTLSSNGAFTKERVLTAGSGIAFSDANGHLTVRVDISVARVEGDRPVSFYVTGATSLRLPVTGTLATRMGAETLGNKHLQKPKVSTFGDFADDAAAATGGVPVGGIYRTGSVLKCRVT